MGRAGVGRLGSCVLERPLPPAHRLDDVDREIRDKLRFKGETSGCDDYDEEHHREPIPGPARAVKIVTPRKGDLIQLEDSRTIQVGSVKDVVVIATTPFDQVVHVSVTLHSMVCSPFAVVRWNSEPLELRIKYEQRVFTTQAPVISCDERWEKIDRLSAQRTTCFYATSVARRYLARANSPTRRNIAPFTCVEVRAGEDRRVTCRAPGIRGAPGIRYVSFRYEL
jgi:hypothetical protein